MSLFFILDDRCFSQQDQCTFMTFGVRNVGYTNPVADNSSISDHLFDAANAGDVSKVNRLIGAGANVNHRVSGRATPLMAAAMHGYVPVVRALLSAGADVNAAIEGGKFIGSDALTLAVAKGHADMVHELISAGADVNTHSQEGVTDIPHPLTRNSHIERQSVRRARLTRSDELP